MDRKCSITTKVNIDIVYVLRDGKIIGLVDLTMKRIKGEFSTYSREPKEEKANYKGKAKRTKLCRSLAMGWRYAENIYLEYDDAIAKTSMKDIQDACNLTEDEEKEVYELGDSMGV